MTRKTKEKSTAKAFHSVKGVADRWDTCERSVRREINAGNLVAHKFGRSLRISDEDLKVYERIRRGQ